jgi:hypothetical protein
MVPQTKAANGATTPPNIWSLYRAEEENAPFGPRHLVSSCEFGAPEVRTVPEMRRSSESRSLAATVDRRGVRKASTPAVITTQTEAAGAVTWEKRAGMTSQRAASPTQRSSQNEVVPPLPTRATEIPR